MNRKRRSKHIKCYDEYFMTTLMYGISPPLIRRGACKEDEMNIPLHYAVMDGDLEHVRRLVDEGFDMNSRSRPHEETPMHWAARYGKVDCLKLLASLGATLTVLDESPDGRGPIHTAILTDNVNIVLWLLNNGIKADFETKNGITPMFYAIRRRNVKIVKALLQKGASVNAPNSRLGGITPLHAAVISKGPKVVKYLLKNGADVKSLCQIYHQSPLCWAARIGNLSIFSLLTETQANVSDNETGTLYIHLAAKEGHASIVEWLLRVGVPANCLNEEGYTPLHSAAVGGHISVAQVLIDKGVNVNCRTKTKEGYTAIHLATVSGNGHFIRFLCQMGAQIHMADLVQKYTALHYAAQNDNLYCLGILFKSGGNIHINVDSKQGETLLETSAKYDGIVVSNWLIRKGFSMSRRGKYGWTPLHYAAYFDCRSVILLLLKFEVELNTVDDEQRTALQCSIFKGNVEVTLLLLSRGADPFVENIHGMNALHYAAMYGKLECAKLLILNDKDRVLLEPNNSKYDDHPLHIAAAYGHIEFMKWLIEDGTSVDVRNRLGCTPLMVAAWEGQYEVVKCLIDKCADIHLTGLDGRTALHSAVVSGNLKLIEFLLQRGADVNVKSSVNGRTPLHWAASEGHAKVVKLLVKSGADTVVKDTRGFTARDLAYSKGFIETDFFLCVLDDELRPL